MKKFILAALMCSLLPSLWGGDIKKAYGPSSVQPGDKSARARGFFGAEEHIYSGDVINGIYGFGFGTTAFSTASGVSIMLKANQNWTDAAQGTKITFETTPDASTTAAEVMSIDDNGNVAIAGDLTISGTTYIAIQKATEAALKVSTPTQIGYLYYDTTNRLLLISTGTTTSYDYANTTGTRPNGW